MRKTAQLFLFLSFSFFSCCTALAGPVDLHTARQRALDFLNQRSSRTLSDEEISLRYATSTTFLFENTTDFALVAANNDLPEILGYGTKNSGTFPPALEAYLKAGKYTPYPAEETTPVEPVEALLPFVRHQRAPYNNACPFSLDAEGKPTPYRCVVGCVATALEEIISYYRRTVVLQDTLHGWESKKHTAVADVLPGTSVDCRLIRNNYDTDDYTPEEADAVARLSYYCGMAAKMNWGENESGANIKNLVDPLKKAFGYGYVNYVDSYQYLPQDWEAMLRKEITAHRPVLYTAFNMWLAGHAFVIDGQDRNGFFHVNWGYAGSYDGYFRLDVLNYNEPPEQLTPEGMEAGFFTNHQALLLHPDAVENTLPDTLSRTGYEICIDSVRLELAAETRKHTPMTVYLRNTTDQYLTTPFELFTNTPQDTAILEQGDFIALGAAILAPREKRVLKIHANFEEAGERILRISPDDKAILYEMPVRVEEGRLPELTFQVPEISFPAPHEALVTLTVSNPPTAGRCGQEVFYELGPGDAQTMKDGVRHSRHLYVLPGETVQDTVRFHYLDAESTYTLLIRSPWKVKTQKTFVTPQIAGISSTTEHPTSQEVQWYTLDGRRILTPREKGIYLRKEGTQIQKIYLQNQ